MSEKRVVRLGLLLAVLVSAATMALVVAPGTIQAQSPGVTQSALSPAAIEALNEVIQDEYHAYATYQAVIDQFGAVRPFSRIQLAEQQHIAALETLFNRYGLAVPEPEPLAEQPQFVNRAAACEAGVAAEVANYELYDRLMDQVAGYPDVVQVFTALRNASHYHHLPAFQRCAGL